MVKEIQERINQVEEQGRKWGFQSSMEKTKIMFFTKKKTGANVQLTLYGNNLEKVKCFRFLGVYIDSRLTWRENIKKISEKM